jgi:transcription antitermination factor NusG
MKELKNISDPISHLHLKEKKWFAIYTKYKCEKFVVERLTNKGIEAYVPLISKTKRYTRKTKHYKVPLINSYAFVHITRSEYVRVLETEYVMGFLKQRKNLISIPDDEINILRRIVGEIELVDINPLSYDIGTPVEIIGGNLTGVKGKLIKRQGKNEFVVELHTIGYQLQMIVDKSMLRPLNMPIGA